MANAMSSERMNTIANMRAPHLAMDKAILPDFGALFGAVVLTTAIVKYHSLRMNDFIHSGHSKYIKDMQASREYDQHVR